MDGIFYAKAAAFLAAAIVMGIGSIGPSIGQGLIGKSACENLGKYPKSSAQISRTMLLSMAVVESSAIYCLVISILLIIFSRAI